MERKLLESLPESLGASLAAVSGARMNGISQENKIGERLIADAIIDITIGNRELFFVAEIRSEVYPRDAREALWKLKRFCQNLDSSRRRYIPMLVAQSISDGAREFLQEEKIAYHDLSGSLHINAGEIFVLIEKPKSRRVRRRDSNVFRGSRAQVLHALFARLDEWVSGTEIAESAGVSPATVSQTFGHLERRDWLEVRGEGPAKRRRLSQPGPLLDVWRDNVPAGGGSKRAGYYVPGMKPEEMFRNIFPVAFESGIDLEFTGQFAAQSYAPFLSTIPVMTVRVQGSWARDRLLSMLDARRASEGANLVVIDGSGYKLSRRMRGDEENPLHASPLRVYLDLLEDHGRSQEMAAHLRAHKLALK